MDGRTSAIQSENCDDDIAGVELVLIADRNIFHFSEASAIAQGIAPSLIFHVCIYSFLKERGYPRREGRIGWR
jgi:hypothetical protein